MLIQNYISTSTCSLPTSTAMKNYVTGEKNIYNSDVRVLLSSSCHKHGVLQISSQPNVSSALIAAVSQDTATCQLPTWNFTRIAESCSPLFSKMQSDNKLHFLIKEKITVWITILNSATGNHVTCDNLWLKEQVFLFTLDQHNASFRATYRQSSINESYSPQIYFTSVFISFHTLFSAFSGCSTSVQTPNHAVWEICLMKAEFQGYSEKWETKHSALVLSVIVWAWFENEVTIFWSYIL